MRTHISSRRCDVSAEMQARAEELADRLGREEPALTLAKLMFEQAEGRRVVSAVVALPDDSLVGHGEASDWSGALAELERRLRRQLEERSEEAVG